MRTIRPAAQDTPQALERWTSHFDARQDAKAAAACAAIEFTVHPPLDYATRMAALTVRTPGGRALPPELWHSIFISTLEDGVVQTLCAGIPSAKLDPVACEQRAFEARIGRYADSAPSASMLKRAWSMVRQGAMPSAASTAGAGSAHALAQLFDDAQVARSQHVALPGRHELMHATAEASERIVLSMWMRGLLKQPMPRGAPDLDEQQKATMAWMAAPVSDALFATYRMMDLPTSRLMAPVQTAVRIAEGMRRTITILPQGAAVQQQRNYRSASRAHDAAQLARHAAQNTEDGSAAAADWALLQAQRNLLSAAWKYSGRVARLLGFQSRLADAAGGWRPYLLQLDAVVVSCDAHERRTWEDELKLQLLTSKRDYEGARWHIRAMDEMPSWQTVRIVELARYGGWTRL